MNSILRITSACKGCDDLSVLPVAESNRLTIYNGAFAAQKYVGGVSQHSITIDSNTNVVVFNGKYYFRNGGVYYECSTNVDAKNTANHVALTLSGFTAGANLILVGVANGNLWFVDTVNNELVEATVSSTTLTQASTLTVAGALYNNKICVSDNGLIWMPFAALPYNRQADFTGSLTGNEIRGGSSSALNISSYEGYAYAPDATEALQTVLY